VPGVLAIGFPLRWLVGSDVPIYVVAAAWMIGFVASANWMTMWKCPRCGQSFFRTLWGGNPLATRCVHCRLAKWVSHESAKKAAAAAVAEARKNNWTMAVGVLDPGGALVYFEKMDGTQTGSVRVAIGKARGAALYKRPTKVWQDIVAGGGGGLRILGLEGAVPIEGGVPLVMDGKVVGAIGLSGGSGDQDGQCARAGADALK
jgi:uncharacterized protein GlcG (DUF336 family)